MVRLHETYYFFSIWPKVLSIHLTIFLVFVLFCCFTQYCDIEFIVWNTWNKMQMLFSKCHKSLKIGAITTTFSSKVQNNTLHLCKKSCCNWSNFTQARQHWKTGIAKFTYERFGARLVASHCTVSWFQALAISIIFVCISPDKDYVFFKRICCLWKKNM